MYICLNDWGCSDASVWLGQLRVKLSHLVHFNSQVVAPNAGHKEASGCVRHIQQSTKQHCALSTSLKSYSLRTCPLLMCAAVYSPSENTAANLSPIFSHLKHMQQVQSPTMLLRGPSTQLKGTAERDDTT